MIRTAAWTSPEGGPGPNLSAVWCLMYYTCSKWVPLLLSECRSKSPNESLNPVKSVNTFAVIDKGKESRDRVLRVCKNLAPQEYSGITDGANAVGEVRNRFLVLKLPHIHRKGTE